jgi:hypothetical protein
MTHLTDLAAQLDGLVATVHPSAVLALITRETPEDIKTRLLTLVTDYPDGIPSELVDMERRRIGERAHMVETGLTDP